LEGLVLIVLGKNVPGVSYVCSRHLQSYSKSGITERFHCEPYFLKETVEKARQVLTELDLLLGGFDGGWKLYK